MTRAWRIEYERALYHVLSRGNEQGDIFFDDEDRLTFLEVLGEMSERFEVDIFAYVLMGNHYHLLIRTNRANLSKSMQWFGATYTKRFNIKHYRTGHLFQGRFKNIIVQNDAYLNRLSYYIHRNPLRAKLVTRLIDYRWSSYPSYGYGKAHPKWLTTDLILSQFNEKDRHKAYREAVQKYSKEEKQIWEDFRHGMILGTKKFVEVIRTRYLPDKPHQEIPHQRQIKKSIDPEVILKEAAKALKCNVEIFRKSSRISVRDKDNRDLLIYLIWELGLLTNQEIGDLFGLTYSSVSRRVSILKIKIKEDKSFIKHWHWLKSQIKM